MTAALLRALTVQTKAK